MVNWDKLELLKAFNLQQIGYVPLRAQIPIHLSRNRVILISGGEGSGKSYVTAAEIVARYGLWKLVYIVGPKYEAAHKEMDYLYESLLRIGATRKDFYQRPTRGKIVLSTVDGARVETLSAEDGAKSITGTGESPDVLAMVEAGKQSYDIYLACRGRVARSRGLLILSGTIEASERWYPELVTRWQADNPEGARSFIIPTWANTKLYPGGRDDPEIKQLEATYPHDQFLERFGAVPVPPSNLVFKEFEFTTHVSDKVAHDPLTSQVEIWIDPGYSGSHYAVEFIQKIPRWRTRQLISRDLPDAPLTDVLVLDEIYASHATTYDVIGTAKSNPLWAYVNGGVGDVAVRQHAALPSHFEIWRDAGVYLRSQPIEIEPNIARHHSFLKDPHSGSPRLFYNPRCKGALAEYGRWKRKEIGEDQYGAAEAGNCDALKAIGYGLIDAFGFVEAAKENRAQRRREQHAKQLDTLLHKALG